MEKLTVVVVSGYFNPLHIGHLRMIRDAKQLGDLLVVIVNNDEQQVLKKGKVILPERDRLEIVCSIRLVDRAVLSIDSDSSVRTTLASLRKEYPDETLIFANGGDRRSAGSIAEVKACQDLDIELKFGVGGHDKADASSRIIEALGV
jgi:cytidyltransferase-like protein